MATTVPSGTTWATVVRGKTSAVAGTNTTGTTARIGTIGTTTRIGIIGTTTRIGTIGTTARIGTIGTTARIGTIGTTARTGTIGTTWATVVAGGTTVALERKVLRFLETSLSGDMRFLHKPGMTLVEAEDAMIAHPRYAGNNYNAEDMLSYQRGARRNGTQGRFLRDMYVQGMTRKQARLIIEEFGFVAC